MCKAFSCIATRRKVYWKLGLDSHNDIKDHFKLIDDANFCPVEITPKNDNYIEPDEWVFKFDDSCPDWWKQSHDEMCWSAKDKWYKELIGKVYKARIKNIIHPFKLPEVKQVTKTDINNLKKWDSIRASVGDSIRAYVGDSIGVYVGDSIGVSVSIRASVGDSIGVSVGDSIGVSVGDSIGVSVSIRVSVGDSIGDSIWASVGDSVFVTVRAYLGYMFKLQRSEWKFTDKIKCKGYPFMPLVKLWKRGLVPSFDGTTWRLHSGSKAKIIFEISKEELELMNDGK